MNSRKKILLLAVAAVALTFLFARTMDNTKADRSGSDQPGAQTFRVGEAVITVAVPEGYQRIDGLDPRLDSFFQALMPSGTKVAAVVAEAEDWKRHKDSEGREELGRYGLVVYDAASGSYEAGPEDLANAKGEMLRTLSNPQSPEVAASVSQVEERLKKMGDGEKDLSVNPAPPTNIRMLGESPDHFTYGLRAQAVVNGQPTSYYAVTTLALLKKKFIAMHHYDTRQSPEAEAESVKVAVDWANAFIAANK